MTCQGKAYISSDRLIPQAIAVLGADVMRIPPRDQVLHAQVEGAQMVGNSLVQEGVPKPISESSQIETKDPEVDSNAISALGTIDIKDVVWVPITLASLAVFFMLTILRIQHVR